MLEKKQKFSSEPSPRGIAIILLSNGFKPNPIAILELQSGYGPSHIHNNLVRINSQFHPKIQINIHKNLHRAEKPIYIYTSHTSMLPLIRKSFIFYK